MGYRPTGHVIATVLLLIYSLTGPSGYAQGKTSIGGYGDAVFSRNIQSKTSNVDLERFVLFVGHEFSKRISLVSELEMEDAKVSGGEEGGEIAFEQAYVQFRCDTGGNVTHGPATLPLRELRTALDGGVITIFT
jgi:hypothetical protein